MRCVKKIEARANGLRSLRFSFKNGVAIIFIAAPFPKHKGK